MMDKKKDQWINNESCFVRIILLEFPSWTSKFLEYPSSLYYTHFPVMYINQILRYDVQSWSFKTCL